MTLAIVSNLLQQRHAFYRTLLAVEVVALVISAVAVLRDSPLLRAEPPGSLATQAMPSALKRRVQRVLLRRQRLVIFWLVALAVELLWQAALEINPSLAVRLSVLHLVVWLGLMLMLLWGLVNALAEEPVFNSDLLIGAAAGYHWWASRAGSCSIPCWCSSQGPSICRAMAMPSPMASPMHQPCWVPPSPAWPSRSWASSMGRS